MNSLNHFLANEWDKSQRQKRGSGAQAISLDADAEERYRKEPAVGPAPERIFDRGWAEATLAVILARLREEFDSDGPAARRFDLLKHYYAQRASAGG